MNLCVVCVDAKELATERMHSCAPFKKDWNLHCILEFEGVFQDYSSPHGLLSLCFSSVFPLEVTLNYCEVFVVEMKCLIL